MANFDLARMALKAICPTNDLIYDDLGMPSVMVRIPKFKIKDVIEGGSDSTHPAFIVNGKEVDAIWISKYQNVVNNNRAYSLPCEDPKTTITFDSAISVCSQKGKGWHLMSRAEWAAIALWCRKNNTMPLGNNHYGKDITETNYVAAPVVGVQDNGKTARVYTGTGPLTWSHDRTPGGIWDLNGNIWEWAGGLRTVFGEVQVLCNNDAADSTNSQAVGSAQWKAIDATTGAYITPDGKGTTANSVKIDWVTNRFEYTTTILTKADTSRSCKFHEITAGSSIAAPAKEVLKALALLPEANTDTYGSDMVWINNGAAERSFYSGAYWDDTSGAGVFALNGCITRGYANWALGFRSAYVELPAV